jgi:catechol 2,3-dioxygenase-like lactoylglutathione lyase family enzyme
VTAKVDHFAFRVADLDESLAFYCNKLGLKQISRTFDAENQEAFAYVELEGGNLELLQRVDESGRLLAAIKQPIESPYCPHLALVTENLDAVVDTLHSVNIPIVSGPLEIPGLVKWLYIADPDNNIIEFVEWLSVHRDE